MPQIRLQHPTPSLRRLAQGVALCAAIALGAGPAPAAGSSWTSVTSSKLRLVAAGATEGGKELAGLQIVMQPGWKTYWRNPGDSGVPPSFDWSGSTNLKDVKVLYPAPHTLDEAGGVAYGYERQVVFPLLVTPDDPAKPVDLKLVFDFGLCRDICVPNHAELALDLSPGGATPAEGRELVARYLAAVPKPAAEGRLPSLLAVKPELSGAKPRLVVDAAFPSGSKRAELYIEAPDGYVPQAKPVGQAKDGRQRFVVTFDDPAGAEALQGQILTLTLAGGDGATETQWRMP